MQYDVGICDFADVGAQAFLAAPYHETLAYLLLT